MTIRTIETKVYTIDSHPNPSVCYEWIRNNWYDLGDYIVEEVIDSLKAFADHIGATLDYSVSIVPHRGEHISFECPHSLGNVMIDIDLSGNCPFTGVYYDEIICDVFRDAAGNANTGLDDVMNEIGFRMLKAIHNEGEYIYSDKGLREMCEANEYEFNEDGSLD